MCCFLVSIHMIPRGYDTIYEFEGLSRQFSAMHEMQGI